jgi:hypothetical protein
MPVVVLFISACKGPEDVASNWSIRKIPLLKEQKCLKEWAMQIAEDLHKPTEGWHTHRVIVEELSMELLLAWLAASRSVQDVAKAPLPGVNVPISKSVQ